MSLMHELYRLELPLLAQFQRLPVFQGGLADLFWLSCTWIGDPKLSFTLYFPLAYGFSRRLGSLVLVAAAVAEFLNGVFKWVLMGERPYWFIYEHKLNSSTLQLMQFPVTCENGPGSPSGHAMVSAATWFILIFALSPTFVSRQAKWILYSSLLTLIAISRLYIAAHFIHQVFFGIMCGFLIGHQVSRRVRSSVVDRPTLYATLSTLLPLLGVGVYVGMRRQGFDPDWSLPLARRWCADPGWLRRDTTPLASLTRNVASLVGAALATTGCWDAGGIFSKPDVDTSSIVHRSASALVNVAVVQLASVLLSFAVPSSSSKALFYSSFFLKHCLDAVLVMRILPRLLGFIGCGDNLCKNNRHCD